jgi:antitoxin (DNA-binding transcriptional repressor) of toxin-antitoxin stability system
MKTIDADQTGLGKSLDDAQRERVVITRAGRPVAILVGVQNLDDEQLALCRDDEFWNLISVHGVRSRRSGDRRLKPP